jgi:UrcA family protein
MTSHHTSSTRFVRAFLISLAATVLGSSALTVHAATAADDVPSVSVSYADLNLATEQGNVALYRRIVAAANKVCFTHSSGPSARLEAESRKCVNDAVARAVNTVQSAKLAELQAARMAHNNRG